VSARAKSPSAPRAAILFGAAEAQRKEAAAMLAPADVPEHDRAVDTLRLRLGSVALNTFLRQGRMLPPLAALEFSEATADLDATQADSLLTQREVQVAALVARGFTDRRIADELMITQRTAEKHVANILDKVGGTTRTQLAVWWVGRAGVPAGG
jgi:serine/threonine-protein kinase PknK